MLFLFFKQKTAYEMRISDWSSDVCSSDLIVLRIIFDLGHRALDEGVVRIRGRDRARIGDEGGRHLFVDPARRANAIGHDRRRARRQSAALNLAGAELVRGNGEGLQSAWSSLVLQHLVDLSECTANPYPGI